MKQKQKFVVESITLTKDGTTVLLVSEDGEESRSFDVDLGEMGEAEVVCGDLVEVDVFIRHVSGALAMPQSSGRISGERPELVPGVSDIPPSPSAPVGGPVNPSPSPDPVNHGLSVFGAEFYRWFRNLRDGGSVLFDRHMTVYLQVLNVAGGADSMTRLRVFSDKGHMIHVPCADGLIAPCKVPEPFVPWSWWKIEGEEFLKVPGVTRSWRPGSDWVVPVSGPSSEPVASWPEFPYKEPNPDPEQMPATPDPLPEAHDKTPDIVPDSAPYSPDPDNAPPEPPSAPDLWF